MSQIIPIHTNWVNRLNFSIFVIWLFHVSGLIGISLGYGAWFLPKTPLNLTLAFILLLLSFPKKDWRLLIAGIAFFVGGMLVEWAGVSFGWFFGDYEYGHNLGPKIAEVPWFIGINWAALTLITGTIATAIFESKIGRIFVGASLMVFLDFFLEASAPAFDFWAFENGIAPFQNYLGWYGVSILFHFIFQQLKLQGDLKFSVHLYLAQFVFFVYFYFV